MGKLVLNSNNQTEAGNNNNNNKSAFSLSLTKNKIFSPNSNEQNFLNLNLNMQHLSQNSQYQQQQQQQSSFKIDDILSTNTSSSTNNTKCSSSSSSSVSSISSISSSSHYSPISVESLIGLSTKKPSDYFSLSQLAASANPFFPGAYHHQQQQQTVPTATTPSTYQQQIEFLKSAYFNSTLASVTTTSPNILVDKQEIYDTENSTSNKLKLVNKYAKQIDALQENNNNSIKKESNTKNNKSDNNKQSSKKSNKLDKLKLKEKKQKLDGCDGCSGNCSDLACSISSVIDQAQLPMCLRGATEEQLHLASLFNTLMHHKKCRRTRTVFTDMQLIGLEKRFENQKYLSTPDRIQLAEALGLSQLQVKTWYQNRRMKWKKKVLKDGCQEAPTKPKGRPKKNSIPSFSEIIKAAAEAANNNGTSNNESCDSRSNLSIDEDDDDENDSMDNEAQNGGYSSDSDLDEIDIEDDESENDDVDDPESLEDRSFKSSNQSDSYLK